MPHSIHNRQKHEISRLPNIGKVLAEKLRKADIHSYHELKKVGAEKAFLRIKAFDKEACLSSLNAIEGAIEGIRWHELPGDRREELKQFFEMQKNLKKKDLRSQKPNHK